MTEGHNTAASCCLCTAAKELLAAAARSTPSVLDSTSIGPAVEPPAAHSATYLLRWIRATNAIKKKKKRNTEFLMSHLCI